MSENQNPVVQRIFAGIISVAALFVTWLAFFQPERMDRAFTWAALPPLHARFVGALYLFGAVYLFGAAVTRHRARMWPAMTGVALFTGSMIVLTLLNWSAFDMDLGPVQGWVVSYVVYPPIAAAIAVWLRWRNDPASGDQPVTPWIRQLVWTLAIVFGILGVLLLVFRDVMVDAWPWPVSNSVAQFYGGPFITLAWVCGAHARAARADEDMLWVTPALLAFTSTALGFSIHHRELFDGGDPAAWVWFVGLAVTSAALVAAVAVQVSKVVGMSTTRERSHSPRLLA